jgi:hypothetical protein
VFLYEYRNRIPIQEHRSHIHKIGMQGVVLLHALCLSPLGFGVLMRKSEARRNQNEVLVNEAAHQCQQSFNHTLGQEWMGCVVDVLLQQQREAKAQGSAHYVAVSEDEMAKLSPGGTYGTVTDELMNLLRNYSCEVADGGSQPVHSFNWTYTPSDPCMRAGATGGDEDDRNFSYHLGFLPAGHDLSSGQMTEAEAKAKCAAEDACAGFTFQEGSSGRSAAAVQNMLFKSSHDGQSSAPGWHAFHKKRQLDCSDAARRERTAPITKTVHLLRKSPPVYVVDDFATDGECNDMVQRTVPHMGRSVVGGGGTSNWRRSYSVNMNPDFDWEGAHADHIRAEASRLPPYDAHTMNTHSRSLVPRSEPWQTMW